MTLLRRAGAVPRAVLVIVLVLVVLLVVGYLGRGLVRTAHVHHAEMQAVSDLRRALPAARQVADEQQALLRRRVAPDGARPTYQWRLLSCELDSRDGGWVVESYEQRCLLRDVAVYPARRVRPGDCETLPVPRLPVVGPSGPRPAAAVTRGSTTALDTTSRTVPPGWASTCPYGLLATARTAASRTRLLGGRRPTRFSGSPGWVVTEVDAQVSTTDVGCGAWAVVFCTPPYDGPRLG